jgi:hypothetical protein
MMLLPRLMLFLSQSIRLEGVWLFGQVEAAQVNRKQFSLLTGSIPEFRRT